MQIIWVTGSAGFLGRHTARAFHNAGWQIAGLDVFDWSVADREAWGVHHWVPASVTAQSLSQLQALTGPPDAIFHAAGGSSVAASIENPDADRANTVNSAEIILNFVIKNAPACRVIVPSSAAVYGAKPLGPIREDAALNPVSPYGHHKLEVEEMARTSGLNVTAIRYFSLYGPFLRKQLLWDLSSKVMAAGMGGDVELFGTGDETRDMMHVTDAVGVALMVASESAPGFNVLNAGTGRALTVREIAHHLVSALGSDVEITFNGKVREGDPRHFQADITKLSRLGFSTQIPFDDGVKDYSRWFNEVMRGV